MIEDSLGKMFPSAESRAAPAGVPASHSFNLLPPLTRYHDPHRIHSTPGHTHKTNSQEFQTGVHRPTVIRMSAGLKAHRETRCRVLKPSVAFICALVPEVRLLCPYTEDVLLVKYNYAPIHF